MSEENSIAGDAAPDAGLSAAQKLFGGFAPTFVSLTDDVLWGQVWPGSGLALRDRSLATIASLVASGNVEQLAVHVPLAISNGLTGEEIVEAVTHLAFYVGWPKAVAALSMVKQYLEP